MKGILIMKYLKKWRIGVALAAATTIGLSQADERPNVVLIMCDDLGWGDVGFNGGTVIETPRLDGLASEGMKFNRFYAAAPVCSPTRGASLTGRHPLRYGIPYANTGHMKPEEWTLAELLKREGYRTGHFGKWHLGALTKTVVEANRGGPRGVAHFSPPQDNGFDVCFSTESKVPTHDPMWKPVGARAGGHWDALEPSEDREAYKTYYWNEKGERVTENLDGANSRVIMDRAVPFIEGSVQEDRPFLSVIWFHTPHLPVVAGSDIVSRYAAYDVHARNYYGCVTAMDQQVGRLVTTLKELGVFEETLLFFCSDNGPEGDTNSPGSAGPFRGRKRSLYEGGVRVPGFAVWPGRVPAGGETDYPAVTSDYLPTILEALEIEYPDDRPIDGLSLWPALNGDITERPKPIAFKSRNVATLSDNRFKLVMRGDRQELYDLANDPGETTDLAESKTDLVTTMRDRFDVWHESVNASAKGADY